MGSHRYYQHAEIPHPHPGPPLEGEGDFAWLNNVANQVVICFGSAWNAQVEHASPPAAACARSIGPCLRGGHALGKPPGPGCRRGSVGAWWPRITRWQSGSYTSERGPFLGNGVKWHCRSERFGANAALPVAAKVDAIVSMHRRYQADQAVCDAAPGAHQLAVTQRAARTGRTRQRRCRG